MKDLFAKALIAYVELLEIHIDSKTGDEPFHEKTWEFYELLFNIAHDIWERYVDLWEALRSDQWDCSAQANRVVELLTTLKDELESVEWVSKGTENLIYNYLDKLEFAIGSATWFTKGKLEMKSKEIEVEIKSESEPEEKVETNKDETLSDEAAAIVM